MLVVIGNDIANQTSNSIVAMRLIYHKGGWSGEVICHAEVADHNAEFVKFYLLSFSGVADLFYSGVILSMDVEIMIQY